MNTQDHKQALPPGFRLGNYRVVRVLGAGGFGVTYLCEHGGLGVTVAVKEYLPNDIAVRSGDAVAPKSAADREGYRWGLSRFLDEARLLARFEHRNVVRVRDFFEANGTAYIVMDYEDGEPLDSVLERTGTLTEAQIKRLLLPIVAGLRQMHTAGFLHRDVKPANIFIRRSDESPVLLDFGSARQALGRLSRSVTAIASSGYSPPEQYESGSEQGPWTDIYALSALCYRAVTGMAPMEATRRQSRLLRGEDDPLPRLADIARGRCSQAFLAAVDRGLRVVEGERQGSLDEWWAELEGRTIGQPTSHLVSPSARGESKAVHGGPKPVVESSAEWRPEPRRRTRTAWLLAGVAVTVTIAAFLFFAISERSASSGEPAEQDPDAKSWFTQALDRYLLRAAAELGDADAQFELALLYNNGEGVAVDQQQAMLWYRKAAEQGLAGAQFRLGKMYDDGEGVAEDDRQAVLWYHKAAEQGLADAQLRLGVMLALGWGAAEDDEQAMMWVRKAAAQGLACAQVRLGQAYMFGVEGVLERDDQQAVLWQHKAAEQGLAFAQWQLGLQYQLGLSDGRDHQQAVLWYRKAAEQGLALAQDSLGDMYDDGEGVAEDDRQAVLWYRKAAEQGFAPAQNNLGEAHDYGKGVLEDDRQAVLWYRRAAEQGHTGAQSRLGVMYAYGLGLPKDAVKSYAWANLAAAQGPLGFAARHRDRIGETMTPNQVAEAQRFGRELAAEVEAAKPVRSTIGGSCG